MNTDLRVVACALLCVLAAPHLASAAEASALAAARESITVDELKKHALTLADDTFEGREAGSRGGRAAANYLVQKLQPYSLRPLGDDGGYFQSFGAGFNNILAYQEGSDPKLKSEVIVVSAHYDHVGYGSSRTSYGPIGYIHNGADDNASGDAGLLELIDAFSKLPTPPKRSILFAFWDGEEKGLLGSQHWAARPTLPLASVRAMVNVDMIGRLRDNVVEVYGSRSSPGFRQLVSRANTDTQLALDFTWEMKGNSDHWSFFEKRVPVLMLHTRLHNDYHRPSDDPEKLNIPGMQQVTRLLFNTTVALAEESAMGPYRANARYETPAMRRAFERPQGAPPPRLGIVWDPDLSAGLVITGVSRGSAAERAGLVKGDKLMKFGSYEVKNEDDFRLQVLAAPASVNAVIHRGEKNEELTLPLKLAGDPVRIGLSWQGDDAEPGTAMIAQVVPGSAADRAGLIVGDRLYEIEGEPLKNDDAVAARFAAARGKLNLLVERAGRLFPASLKLAESAKTRPENSPLFRAEDRRCIESSRRVE